MQDLEDQIMMLRIEKGRLEARYNIAKKEVIESSLKIKKMEKREDQIKQSLVDIQDKLRDYKVEKKDLQKSIVFLMQKFSEILKQISSGNNEMLRAVKLMLKTLISADDFNFEKITPPSPEKYFKDIFEFAIKTLLTGKQIDYAKIMTCELKGFPQACAQENLLSSIKSSYLDMKETILSSTKQRDEQGFLKNSNASWALNESMVESERRNSLKYSKISMKHMRKDSMGSVCSDFNLQNILDAPSHLLCESFRIEEEDLNSKYESLCDIKEDLDIQIKLSERKNNKLKREIEKMESIIVTRRTKVVNLSEQHSTLLKQKNMMEEVLIGNPILTLDLECNPSLRMQENSQSVLPLEEQKASSNKQLSSREMRTLKTRKSLFFR